MLWATGGRYETALKFLNELIHEITASDDSELEDIVPDMYDLLSMLKPELEFEESIAYIAIDLIRQRNEFPTFHLMKLLEDIIIENI